MTTIYKFALDIYSTKQDVILPEGSKIVSCDFQGEVLVMWVICDPGKPLSDRKKLLIIRTGEEFPEGTKDNMVRFIGTAYDRNLDTPFVIHLFEYL